MHPEDMLQAPSWTYLLGADQMGRDVMWSPLWPSCACRHKLEWGGARRSQCRRTIMSMPPERWK
jgi:hypothetical protein